MEPEPIPRAEPEGPPAAAVIVEAAGALCWRRGGDGGLELLLVHSARWGDWSWPKGKQERREPLPVTAVREVQEETGAQIRLGRPLETVEYLLPEGVHKRVTYWSAQVLDEGPASASPEEISEAVWLPVGRAEQRLTRPTDIAPLYRLLNLDEAGLLDAAQLIVVRHAKAVSRASWDGDDASRPLHPAGVRQVAAFTSLLNCWQPDRLVSSPWTRCEQTMAPYAQAHGLALELDPALTEDTEREHPARTRERVASLLAEPSRIAACTHRPVLAAVIDTIGASASDAVRACLPDADPWLHPAQLLIAHHQSGRVAWVEKH